MFRKSTIEALEYQRILNIISSYWPKSISFRPPEFLKSSDSIENRFSIVKDLMELIEIEPEIADEGLEDITDIVSDRGKGVVFAPYEIKSVYKMNKYFSKVYGIAKRSEYRAFAGLILNMEDYPVVSKKIEAVFDAQFEVKDGASPTLKFIRKQIKQKEMILRKRLESFMKKHKDDLQEEIITIREGRYVIPVKREFRSKAEGVVHGISNTGNTLFVEPSFAVDINNDVRTLKLEEKQEIYKILLELTHFIMKFRDSLVKNMMITKELIEYIAIARYARDYGCIIPEFAEGGEIRIVSGRHPVLLSSGKEIVPISLNIPEGVNTVVISGPNAGGKTATLKLIGIFSLMFQSGIPIPADSGTILPVFDNVFAVIGDDQSVAESVSTFTANMIHLKEVLKSVSSRSLVLLDELGSSTAPREGAALAIAIIRKLKKKGAKTFITTHFDEIKQFASGTEDSLNLAMGFDIKEGIPTYHIFEGIPGSSYAFSIAKMVGFDEDVVNEAQKSIGMNTSSSETDFVAFQEKIKEIERKEKLLDEKLRYYDSIIEKYEQRLKGVKKEAKDIIERAKIDKEKILNETRREIERLVKEIKESNASKESIKKARKILSKPKKMENREGLVEVREGDFIKLRNISGIGKVKKILGGKIVVDINGTSYTVARSSVLEKVEDYKEEPKGITVKLREERDMSYDLDIRGKRVGEGVNIVDRYIDDAMITGVEKFRIIHGKGTGALKNAIYKFLKNDNRVASFYADEGPGGDGCTIVEL